MNLSSLIRPLLLLQRQIKKHPPSRQVHLYTLKDALEHNIQLLSSIMKSLPSVNNREIGDDIKKRHGYVRYKTALNYLRRDWGSQRESQAEVATIETRVSQLLHAYCNDTDSLLVLGAGAGRFAYDLSALFHTTVAVDISIVMAHLYQHIQQSDINFYHIMLKNAKYNDQQCQLIKTSINSSKNKLNKEKNFIYTVADASSLPLKAHSISAIVSIYFTDVLPLSKLWPEVIRVLKPGGVFIHYGPLQYHFDDIDECYSAEDLKSYLESQQFSIYDEQWNRNAHLSFLEKNELIYDNWSFAAVSDIK